MMQSRTVLNLQYLCRRLSTYFSYYVSHGAISIVRICTLMMNMSSPFMSGRILCVLQDFVAQVAGRRIQYHQSYHELSRRECLTKVILPEFDHFFIHEIGSILDTVSM